jgi:Putative amidoligase enzyme
VTIRRSRRTARTFGIEIEGIGASREAIARAIEAAGVPCMVEGYNHYTRTFWKIVTDGSIETGGQRGRVGFEVVSPVLSGEEGLAQVRKVMDAIASTGATVNKSCGLHVHIGARDFSLRELRNIAKNYVIFEDFFDAIMPPSRRASANQYIKSNRRAMGGDYSNAAAKRACEKLDGCRTVDEIIEATCPNPLGWGRNRAGRYYKLNLTAFWAHGTVEFRQHSGTVEADKACAWIELLLQFVNRAAITRQRPTERAVTTKGQIFSAFFRSFKITGLKPYFTARRDQLHGGND